MERFVTERQTAKRGAPGRLWHQPADWSERCAQRNYQSSAPDENHRRGAPPSKNPYWDSILPGLASWSAGMTRSYIVQKRLPDGRQCKVTIGRHGAWTTEKARARAKVLLGQIAAGIDPTADRRAARQAERKRLEAPTVQAMLDRYMDEHAKPKKRQRSVESDKSLINKHILPNSAAKKSPMSRGRMSTAYIGRSR